MVSFNKDDLKKYHGLEEITYIETKEKIIEELKTKKQISDYKKFKIGYLSALGFESLISVIMVGSCIDTYVNKSNISSEKYLTFFGLLGLSLGIIGKMAYTSVKKLRGLNKKIKGLERALKAI